MNKKWFSFTAAAENDTKSTEIYIFDYIGSWEISARSFIEQLKNVDTEHIALHINSPGGSVFDGVAIQNSLKHHKASVTVYIDGIAASIASIIALAGDEIKIADNAYVMIHNPASIVWGEAKDMLKEAEVLNKLADGLAGDYARRMGISLEAARALMDEETWYLGQEAVAAGFADATFEGSQATASFNLDRVSAKAPKDAVARFAKPAGPHNNGEQIMSKEQEEMEKQKAQAAAREKAEAEAKAKAEAEAKAKTEADRTTQPTVEEAVAAALKVDRQRQADIRELGTRFGFQGDAETFSAEGKSLEDFRAHILNQSPEKWRASLTIKNPANQQSEEDLRGNSEGDAAVAKIKERRQARYVGK